VYIIVKIGHTRDIQRFNISTPKSLIATRLFIFLLKDNTESECICHIYNPNKIIYLQLIISFWYEILTFK